MTCAALCVPHSTAVFDREQHTLSLPAANSITYVLRFLEKLCHNLRSDNLFGNQPFAQTHGHARYLPGRSWDGAGVKKGDRARRSPAARPRASPLPCSPGTCSPGIWFSAPDFCHGWDLLVSAHLSSPFGILSPVSGINPLSSGFLCLEKSGGPVPLSSKLHMQPPGSHRAFPSVRLAAKA